jgi:hypothetical protein
MRRRMKHVFIGGFGLMLVGFAGTIITILIRV